MTDFLDQLWRSRLVTLVANLAEGEREHEEIASLARHIGADYAGRFLVELLQNADDQACIAHVSDTTVVIVRTATEVAVTNQGAPFKEEGIRDVTSLGVSPKDAAFTIGNKGVGFKAVFQITDSPELYSAPSTLPEASFDAPNGLWFGLHQAPLEQPGMRDRVRELAVSVLADHPVEARKIAMARRTEPLEVVMEGVLASAPFRYPIPLGEASLRQRQQELSLPRLASSARTLVVLPLLRLANGTIDPEVDTIVSKAIDDLLKHGAAISLFLKGVQQIMIDDRVRSIQQMLSRDAPMAVEKLTRGSRYSQIATHCRSSESTPTSGPQQWLLVSRTIGLDASEAEAQAESRALNDAARQLPGKNWQKVARATVSVAVPIPADDAIGGSLGTDGILCIGLPTAMPTATPMWLDARFHANISRLRVDWDATYNRILRTEAIALVGDLLDRLKKDDRVARRRLVALVLEPSPDANASLWGDALFGTDGIARGPVVLADDGLRLLAPSDLALPDQRDAEYLRHLAADLSVEDFGFVLPDHVLMHRGREVLEKLPGYHKPPGLGDPRFLTRQGDGTSLIEHGASRERSAGPVFWSPFLTWLLDRYDVSRLTDQRFLPVGRDALAAPESRVFYRPWKASENTQAEEASDTGEEEEDLGVLPDLVLDGLPFLDEKAVPIREDGKKRLGVLGARLAASKGGVVRPPRRLQLINDVIIPRLRDIARSGDDESTRFGLALLQQALQWASAIKPGTSDFTLLRRADLLVPTIADDRTFSWTRPGSVYFGRRWFDGRHDDLLACLHGDRVGHALVPWHQFETLLPTADASRSQREWWVQQLLAIGVAATPRLRTSTVARAMYNDGQELRPGAAVAPWPDVAHLWTLYQRSMAGTRVLYTRRGSYDLTDASWLDGLEREDSRAAALELAASRPGDYVKRIASTLIRDNYKEVVNVPSFWVWALTSQQWSVIPLSDGTTCPPQQAWWLEHEQRGDTARFKLLRSVPIRFAAARDLFQAIGVTTLAEATVGRIILALHDVARLLSSDAAVVRAARALAAELYFRLASFSDDSSDALPILRAHPIPVLKGDTPVAAAPDSIPLLYVDDDPARRAFLGDPRDQFSVPLRSETPEARLADVLQQALGKEAVALTSSAAVDTGFVGDAEHEELLLDILETTHPGATVDLGLLVAYAGRTRLDPAKEDFRRQWEILKRTRVRRGHFSVGFERRAFFEPQLDGAPHLLINASLDWHQLFEETWSIIGVGHRDAIAAYARETPERRRRFFHERRIGDAERLEIESVLGQGWQPYLQVLKPAFLTIWRRSHPQAHLEAFEEAWRTNSDRLDRLAEWLEEPVLETLLPDLRGAHRDLAVSRLVVAVALDWGAFAAAVEELGLTWPFEASVAAFSKARQLLWATLAAAAARLPSIDLDLAKNYLAELKRCEPLAADVARPTTPYAFLRDLSSRTLAALTSRGLDATHSPIADRLHQILLLHAWTDDLLGKRGPTKREIAEFHNKEEAERRALATEVATNYLDAARAAATDPNDLAFIVELARNERLTQLRAGYFANPYSFLHELSERLRTGVPAVFRHLSNAQVFDEIQPRSVLQNLCPAMVQPAVLVPSHPASEKLLGLTIETGMLTTELRDGGKLGEALKEAARKEGVVDLVAMGRWGRETAPTPPVRQPGGRPGSGKPPRQANAGEREFNGRLGEAFVYMLFQRLVPGFNYSHWVSENAVAFGVASTGDDGVGCDFRFFDEAGAISGKPGIECFIEVKSTVGAGAGPFSISVNEWLRATEAHDDPNRKLYAVLRVVDVRQTPRLLDLLVDPVQMRKDGRIELADQDMWAYVGAPQTAQGVP